MIGLIEQPLQILAADETISTTSVVAEQATVWHRQEKARRKEKEKARKKERRPKGNKTKGNKGKGHPGKGKDQQQIDSSKAPEKKDKPCRFFFTPAGCCRKNCMYSHDEKFRKDVAKGAKAEQEDASYAPEASRSRSGGCIQYAGSMIRWYSTRQTVTAWSVCEAETDGLAEALSQGVFSMF